MAEQLYSPDGGNTWLTAAQMAARGYSVPSSSGGTTTAPAPTTTTTQTQTFSFVPQYASFSSVPNGYSTLSQIGNSGQYGIESIIAQKRAEGYEVVQVGSSYYARPASAPATPTQNTSTNTSGLVMVQRGTEPAITVSQQAWNDVYSKNGYTMVSGASGSAGGGTTSTVSNDSQINSLYQKYFDRNATSAEISNWSKESVGTLESFLAGEAKKYNYTSQYFQNNPTASPGTGSTTIPFKAGLSAAQQQSITDLMNKPVSQWTATDKDNWNYATNNSPLPTQSSTGANTLPPTSTTGTTGTSPTGTGSAGTGTTGTGSTTTVNPADATWINSIYNKYFDRTATSSELANWAKESPQALEQFLMGEAKKYGYTSQYFRDSSNARLDEALGIINNSNLPPELKNLWGAVVKGYPAGVEYDTTEILNTFNNIKSETIDPYYRSLADAAVKDFKNALSVAEADRQMELEKERLIAGENIRQAKTGLEKAGLTFSGAGVQTLGDQSAYAVPGSQQNSGSVFLQTPYGGYFYEGQVNQLNRLMASSSAARNKQTIDALNLALEKNIGTDAAALAGAKVQGGITGTLQADQQSRYGSTLNQIIQNYRAKQTALTNSNYTS